MSKRQDLRREKTSFALIEAAESLFARFGVEGVSTRRLGEAIGSSNTNVVSYYFGTKEVLVEAVYRHRLPDIDLRRGELLRQAQAAGQAASLPALLRAFALPLFEQTDGEGQHSYARFVAGVERSGMIATRAEVDSEFPESAELVGRIAALLPVATVADAHRRIRLGAALIVASLQIADQECRRDAGAEEDDAGDLFRTALTMAAAGLTAPTTCDNDPRIDR